MPNHFHVLAAISAGDGPIHSCSGGNHLRITRNKHGYKLTIGISHDVGDKLLSGELIASHIFVGRADYFSEAARQEKAEKETSDV